MESDNLRQSTYYKVLGVSNDATLKEIRRAYLKLSMVEHPDKGGDAERFAAVQKAYAVLTSEAERFSYDDKLVQQHNVSLKPSTAFVHGQTWTPTSGQSWPETAFFADETNSDAFQESVKELTGKINILQASIQTELDDERSTKDEIKMFALADLYIQRANKYMAMDRLHHAEFDAREALALRQGCERAIAVLDDISKCRQEEPADFS
jgi:curved DNA-binding protein CbpA